ncbi:MAG: prsA 3 [Gemmataceae bacterium]|nr:prsA 3 [Gemmataceae bacterium]
MTTEPRRMGILRGRRWVRGLAAAGVVLAPGIGSILAHEPPRPLPAAVTNESAKRVVAYIYQGIPVTREDLGEFLISRGGMDKIDLLVNRRIIETEAARRGLSVTQTEIDAGLGEDLSGINVNQAEFVQAILPRYGKTLFEWEQDVVRPRILLGKMCRGRVQATDADLMRAFETRYGEKREGQIVIWPKGANMPALTQEVKTTARGNPVEFDKLAAGQPDQRFAGVRGRLAPVGRHLDGEDSRVTGALFALKEGEISEWIETDTMSTCIRCLKVIPPDPVITPAKVRIELEKDVIDRKLNAEIPAFFAELKKTANPTLTVHVPVPPQADPKVAPPVRAPVEDPRVLAVIYGNVPVTREDLGEFLIARGGHEKLELLVNKKILETEMARRGVMITPQEIEAAQAECVKKLGISMDDFVKQILPRQKLTPQTWTEDVIRPELALMKVCKDRVQVTDDDLRKAFENRYGEKRQAKIILWRKDEFRQAQKQWDEARKGDVEFDRIARGQSDPNLASACGQVASIGRYGGAENPKIEEVVFTLRVGEVSQLFETPAGIMCVKCTAIVPPAIGTTLDMVRTALEKDVYEKKLAKEIPAYFAEMKKLANPNLLLKGPPTAKEYEEGVLNLIQAGGIKPPTK